MSDVARRSLQGFLALTAVVLALVGPPTPEAAAKPRPVLVLTFDTSQLERDEQWIGEAVSQVIGLGLAQHPGFVQIDRARLRAIGQPDAWGETVALQAARTVRAEAVLIGRVTRQDGDFVIHPRLFEPKGASSDSLALEPIVVPAADITARLAQLPLVYIRTMKVALTPAETTRIEKAAQPTRSLRALELYARAHQALSRGGQDGNEMAVDLLAKAIEVDSAFAVAHYVLGSVHQALGNRWKAAAQFRASTQLDASYPEPFKALGDLFLAAPRRLFDQAIEAYGKAIELRPFFADAHVGLGDAKAAKGDVDGAIGAYQKALVFNPVNPRVHMSLGKIYYSEKGLYYEAVNAYKRAIDLDAQSVEARMGLGEVYEDKGLYKEALEEYRKVIELDSKHTGAMYNLALVYEKVDPREAIAQWERYIALASSLPAEKDWVDVARQHLRKLRNQIKD